MQSKTNQDQLLRRIFDRIYTSIEARSGKRIAAYFAFSNETEALKVKEYLETFILTSFIEINLRANQTFAHLPKSFFELEVIGATTKLVVCISNRHQGKINIDCLPIE
jgi:hypothetical protein